LPFVLLAPARTQWYRNLIAVDTDQDPGHSGTPRCCGALVTVEYNPRSTTALAFAPAVHELIQKRESLAGLMHDLYTPVFLAYISLYGEYGSWMVTGD
jgi:hypothetical protein